MPEWRGRQVSTTAYVDASHAANRKTRRSHSGFILFVNRAPISWHSKGQKAFESSTFSSEFIAMKTCVEAITALRYKLWIFGVPIDEPTNVLCDNISVVNNSSKIESTLHKKHNSIAYHAVRWAVAASIIRVGKIDTNFNLPMPWQKDLRLRRETVYSVRYFSKITFSAFEMPSFARYGQKGVFDEKFHSTVFFSLRIFRTHGSRGPNEYRRAQFPYVGVVLEVCVGKWFNRFSFPSLLTIFSIAIRRHTPLHITTE